MRDGLGRLAKIASGSVDDLAQLEKQMRDAARDLAGGQQQAAATKLRDALGHGPSSPISKRACREARTGCVAAYDPNSSTRVRPPERSPIAAG